MIPAKAATPCGCMTPSARPRSPAKTGKCSLCVAGTTTAGPAVISRRAKCGDVWSLNADGTFTQLTTWSGNDGWPASDGRRSTCCTSPNRTVNLWRQPKSGGQATKITSFTEMDIHDWSLAANNKVAVAHRWDQLHRIDFDGESSTVTPLTITAPSDAMADAVESLSGKTTQAALSPDGKTVALIAGNDLYVRDAEGNRPARLVFGSEGREEDPVWSTDGNTLWFVSDLTGTRSIHAAKVTFERSDLQPEDPANAATSRTNPEKVIPKMTLQNPKRNGYRSPHQQLVRGPGSKSLMSWSEALKTGTLRRSPEAKGWCSDPPEERWSTWILNRWNQVLFDHWDGWIDFDLSPDGEWMAYAQHDLDFNSDIFLMRLDGSQAPINLTRHPDNDEHPRFSADGRLLVFTSERKAEAYDIMVVALDAEYDRLLEADQEAYHDKAKKAAADHDHKVNPNEWSWSLDDAGWWRRLTTLDGDETALDTPGGEAIIFRGSGSHSGLHRIDWKGAAPRSAVDPCKDFQPTAKASCGWTTAPLSFRKPTVKTAPNLE